MPHRRTGQAVQVPIDRIDHVQLAMPPGGESSAVAFYEVLLGIAHVPKPPDLALRGGCWFEDHGVKVHLGVEQDFHPAKKAHPAFVVADLRGLVETLRDAGIEIVDDEPLDGYERAYAYDPFGNRLELMERAARPAPPTGCHFGPRRHFGPR